MKNPFLENGYLSPEASLNKLKLATAQTPYDIRGKTALDVVSGAVFIEQIDSMFSELGVRTHHSNKHRKFIECLDDPYTRPKAGALLQRLGESLGHILFALKFGASAREDIRPEWTDAHWEYWNNIEYVYLSGGLSYGIIGKWLVQASEDLFVRLGRPFALKLAENSEYLPLIGAYQHGVWEAGHTGISANIIVMDFGHTYVKRGFVCDSKFTVLDRIGSIARYMYNDETEDVNAGLLSDFIIGVILDTYDKALRACKPPTIAAVSIANYVNRGAIYSYRGEYGRLSAISENYEEYLSYRLSQRLGHELRVLLIHDGTAAAYGIDNPAEEHAAVITLGTGLGVGFCDMRTWPYKTLEKSSIKIFT